MENIFMMNDKAYFEGKKQKFYFSTKALYFTFRLSMHSNDLCEAVNLFNRKQNLKSAYFKKQRNLNFFN